MEYLYYCVECGFDDDEEPVSVYSVDKRISEPDPETLFCDICNKETKVKRYLGMDSPAVIVPQSQFKYEGKFKKFYSRKQEDINRLRSTGLTVPEFIKSADISWEETKVDKNGKEYNQKVYPKDNVIPTDKWNKIPREKRKIAHAHGIYPSKDYVR